MNQGSPFTSLAKQLISLSSLTPLLNGTERVGLKQGYSSCASAVAAIISDSTSEVVDSCPSSTSSSS